MYLGCLYIVYIKYLICRGVVLMEEQVKEMLKQKADFEKLYLGERWILLVD